MNGRAQRLQPIIFLLFLTAAAGGCAHSRAFPPAPPHTVYVPQGKGAWAPDGAAPLFLVYEDGETYNRIGRPTARLDAHGREVIFVDPNHPAVYAETRRFATSRGRFTNHVFRIHFQQVPFSLVPFHLTAGKNVGILVIVTTDGGGHPLLVTTMGTCGCYAAIVPTSFLPREAYPEDWKGTPLQVYGETLPALLDFRSFKAPRLLVHIGPSEHRVTHLEVVEESTLKANPDFRIVQAELWPVEALESLPLDGGATSFYYGAGPLRGHVKDAFKPFEMLLLGPLSLDLLVGMDKVYGHREVTGNPFYTSLKPWNRHASDAGDFPAFLRFNGWRL